MIELSGKMFQGELLKDGSQYIVVGYETIDPPNSLMIVSAILNNENLNRKHFLINSIVEAKDLNSIKEIND